MQQAQGQRAGFAHRLLTFEFVDQFDGGEEAHAPAQMFDRMHTDGGGQVSLAGAGSTDQHDVLRLIHEVSAVQLTHQRLIDRALREVEAGDVAIDREPCALLLIGDGTHLAFGDFRL